MSQEEDKKGFYVEPKQDCPHILDHCTVKDLKLIASNGQCVDCGHDSENWCCLTCGKRFCSRYIKGHMKQHYDTSKHPICVSYSDFSFWCYECDSYITHPGFRELLKLLSSAKFGDAGTGGRYTAHASMQQMEEIEDPPSVLEEKIQQLVDMIKNSKHMISFTGAGISTSAGIPDYRGPQGVWTLKATGGVRTEPTVPLLKALPTTCHMALVKLHEAGYLKYLASQNVDGLHRRSGFNPNDLGELHGNTNLEICEKCGKEYLRDFDCQQWANADHYTLRNCSSPGCDGKLKDSIINFGEKLPFHIVSRGFEDAKKADLCLAMGSSLTVTPAADIPRKVGESGHNLVIINLQRTPLDSIAKLRIFAKVDTVMAEVMKRLGIEIPPFLLKRQVLVGHGNGKVLVEAVDSDGTPLSLFRGVEGTFDSGRELQIDMKQAPFVFPVESGESGVNLKLYFMGHYNEPPHTINYKLTGDKGATKFLLAYNPMTGVWVHTEEPYTAPPPESSDAAARYPPTVVCKGHEHTLHLKPQVYQGAYRCNECMKTGSGWVYTCEPCQFDAHPSCVLWKR